MRHDKQHLEGYNTALYHTVSTPLAPTPQSFAPHHQLTLIWDTSTSATQHANEQEDVRHGPETHTYL